MATRTDTLGGSEHGDQPRDGLGFGSWGGTYTHTHLDAHAHAYAHARTPVRAGG